jgi:hypothetical protein
MIGHGKKREARKRDSIFTRRVFGFVIVVVLMAKIKNIKGNVYKKLYELEQV